MNRRTYLALAGAVGAGGLAGCLDRFETDEPDDPDPGTDPTPVPRSNPTPGEDEIEGIDVVEAGADPEGEEPIDPVLETYVDHGTRLHFPSGTYLLESLKPVGLADFEMVAPDGATLVPPDGVGNEVWLYFQEMENFTFEGFTLDNTASDASPAHMFNAVGGDNLVKDVTVVGFRDLEQHCIRPWPEGEGTSLTLENVRMTDGNVNGAAVYVPSTRAYHADVAPGKLRFENCRIDNFSQGVYGSAHGGPLEIVGGEYSNCGIAQVRVGGGQHGALVEGVTIRADEPAEPISSKANMRGIYVREGSGTVIRNCEFVYGDLNGSYSDAAIQIHFYQGRTEIQNTRMDLDADVPAILAHTPEPNIESSPAPSLTEPPTDWSLHVDGLRVSAPSGSGPIVRVRSRPGSRFENVCLESSASDRTGFSITHGDDYAIRNTTVDVEGEPFVVANADVARENVHTDVGCDETPSEDPSTIPNWQRRHSFSGTE